MQVTPETDCCRLLILPIDGILAPAASALASASASPASLLTFTTSDPIRHLCGKRHFFLDEGFNFFSMQGKARPGKARQALIHKFFAFFSLELHPLGAWMTLDGLPTSFGEPAKRSGRQAGPGMVRISRTGHGERKRCWHQKRGPCRVGMIDELWVSFFFVILLVGSLRYPLQFYCLYIYICIVSIAGSIYVLVLCASCCLCPVRSFFLASVSRILTVFIIYGV